MTPPAPATAGGAHAPGWRGLDGHSLSVRRRPADPGRPIDYAALSHGVLPERDGAEGGYAAGYEAGYEDGRRDADAAEERARHERGVRADQAIVALSRSVGAARAAYEERAAELERAVPRFAFDLLETLFGRESALAAEPGREAIARALTLDGTDRPAAVRLHPDDAAAVGDVADLAPTRTLTVVADPAVEPGGALVEVGQTTIDSQLSRALDRVRDVIAGHAGAEGR